MGAEGVEARARSLRLCVSLEKPTIPLPVHISLSLSARRWVEAGGDFLGEAAWFDAFPRELEVRHAVAAYQFWSGGAAA